ncbi:MAG TPA: redoxin domain-containing protein [Hanamia sp.]
MKYIIGLLATLLPILSGTQSPPIKPLTIGDTVPDIEINNIINYKDSTAKLSDFKDKLVILDFMNTYCLSCIEALPRFDSLQHQYGDKLQIFIVTNETKERVEKFLKTNPVAKNVSIPVIMGDTILERLFPHRFVSHEAWINNGIVKAITGSEYVKGENVLTILSGKTPGWEVKNDIGDYDYNSSIMVVNATAANYLSNDNKIFQSVLTPCLKGIATRYIRHTDSINKVVKIKAINYSIAGLYLLTLTVRTKFPFSHVLLPSDDADLFEYRDRSVYRNMWQENNTYCYEATFPITTSPKAIREKINLDLDTYLQVQGRFEIRKMASYLLIKDTPTSISKKYVPGDYATLSSEAAADQLVFISPGNLVNKLNNTFWGVPFFNGISPSVRMAIKLDAKALDNIQSLKNALKKQNLVLKPVTRNVEMLVLIKTKNNQFTKLQN